MKKIFIGISVLFIISCNKMLDTVPKSFGTVDNFYQSSNDAELALTGVYAMLTENQIQGYGTASTTRATFGKRMFIFMDAGTDELTLHSSGLREEIQPFALFTTSIQDEFIKMNFLYWYAGINRANYLLEKIQDIKMDKKRKKEMVGEAHFLRGIYYLYLAWMYGGVPLYTTPDHDPKAQREPLNEVYDLIIEDLQHAYDSLPDRAASMGRANKWSAAGYLAKVYTYLGSAKINNVGIDLNFSLNSFNWVDWQEMYAKALTITEDIIDHSGYQLITQYDYLFRETTDEFKNQECLFMAMSSDNVINSTNAPQWNSFLIPQGNINNVGGGSGWLRPFPELWYKYNLKDKRRNHNITYSFGTGPDLEDIEGVSYYVPRPVGNPTNGAVCIGKFRYMNPDLKTIPKQFTTGAFPLLRYADILLLHSEALYYNGREVEARNYLDKIWERAVSDISTDVPMLRNAYERADFIEELLDERSRELCFEAWRRLDLIRFGRMDEELSKLDPEGGPYNEHALTMQKNWESYKIWYPIPNSEIDLSKIRQNPGYIN